MFDFLKRLFSSPKPTPAAGIFFSDERHVLSAYQKKNGNLIVSGLGGKQEPTDATIYYTAIRETLEELYDIKPSDGLINRIIHAIHPTMTIQAEHYTTFYMSFEQLARIMHIVADETQSPIYRQMPHTIHELISNRRSLPTSEVSSLALQPMESTAVQDKEFMHDIESFKKLIAPRISIPI
jgi:hypothetical protein